MGSITRASIWSLASMCLCCASLAAQEARTTARGSRPPARPVPVTVQVATSTIELDGVLNEGAWADANAIPLPWEVAPGNNTPARLDTDCRVTFDDRNLYFGCRATDDDIGAIRAFLTDRDDIGGQDQIGLMIDPFQDQRRGFAFVVSPLGVQSDFVFVRGEGNDAWDAIWDAEAQVTEGGYTVEAAIPFKSLRFPAGGDVQSWNFYFWRIWPRSQLVSLRSVPNDQADQCALCQLGTATGFHSMSAGSNFEVTPTVTAQRSDARTAPSSSSLTRGEVDDQYALDARWSVTSDLTLNATVNPDFSQVEADAAQLQANQQFALFFAERRPFFLEGAEFFETPLQAVFTRSIADPSFGAKLTGKVGGWAVGGLLARDETTNLIFPGSRSSSSGQLDQGATMALGRVRRDVGGSHTIGGLVTAREGTGYHNRVVGVDARVQVVGPLTASGQVLRSETQYPADVASTYSQPTNSFAGTAAAARVDFETRNWWGRFAADRLDADFRADAGFVTGADQRGYDWRIQRKWWLENTKGLTRFAIMGGAGHRDDNSGRPLNNFVFTAVSLQGAMQSSISLNPDYFQHSYEGQRFYVPRLNVIMNVQPTARIESGAFLQFGQDLDFNNARNSGLVRLGPWIDFRIGHQTNLEFDYTFKRLTYEGQRVFREQIGEVKALYYLSRRAYARVLVQIRDLVRDPALYRDPVTEGQTTVATQLLFSYKLNPQSVLFVGYSDDSIDERENTDPSLGLVRMTRAFFFKLSYAWRP